MGKWNVKHDAYWPNTQQLEYWERHEYKTGIITKFSPSAVRDCSVGWVKSSVTDTFRCAGEQEMFYINYFSALHARSSSSVQSRTQVAVRIIPAGLFS